MAEKHEKILQEISDEIESALSDSKGILAHQRRLAFSLSLGSVTLIEKFLEKKNVLKPGAKINHLWLKKKPENAKKFIAGQIITPIENIVNFDGILEKAYAIEKERNELAYGKIVSEDFLREQINVFLDLKKEAEK
jgi:hypothetical protein